MIINNKESGMKKQCLGEEFNFFISFDGEYIRFQLIKGYKSVHFVVTWNLK